MLYTTATKRSTRPVVEAALQLALVGGIVVGGVVALVYALSGGYVERM